MATLSAKLNGDAELSAEEAANTAGIVNNVAADAKDAESMKNIASTLSTLGSQVQDPAAATNLLEASSSVLANLESNKDMSEEDKKSTK